MMIPTSEIYMGVTTYASVVANVDIRISRLRQYPCKWIACTVQPQQKLDVVVEVSICKIPNMIPFTTELNQDYQLNKGSFIILVDSLAKARRNETCNYYLLVSLHMPKCISPFHNTLLYTYIHTQNSSICLNQHF